jgi:hypothetical protein
LKPPIPTPATGWWTAMCAPRRTSVPRPLVVLFVLWPNTSCRTLGTANAAASTTTPVTIASATPRRPHANTAASTTPAARAAKLDCEYEK